MRKTILSLIITFCLLFMTIAVFSQDEPDIDALMQELMSDSITDSSQQSDSEADQGDDLSWLDDLGVVDDTTSQEEDLERLMQEAEQSSEQSASVFTIGWEGYLKTSLYFRVSDYEGATLGEMANFMNQNIFSLGISAAVSAMAFGKARINFRNYNFSDPNNFTDLGDRQAVEPYDVELEYAYIEFIDLGLTGLNLKVGKALNTWGEAFLISPIDVINPEDLLDPTDFTNKLATTSVHLEYNFLSNFGIEVNFIPLFTPSMLPSSIFNFSQMANDGFDFGTTPLTINSLEDEVVTPDVAPENFSYGARFTGRFGPFTFGIIYYYGYDDFPFISQMDISVSGSLTDLIADISIEASYSPMQVAGLGMKYAWGDFHFVAEGGFFFPEEEDLVFNITCNSDDPILCAGIDAYAATIMDEMGIPEKSISGDWFFRGVAGFDYLFGDGYVFYVLYMYGFFFERKGDALNSLFFQRDYLSSMFVINFLKEWSTAGVKVELGVMLDAGDFKHTDGLAVIVTPSITYMPTASTEITLKGNYVDSYKMSYLYLFRQFDLFKLSFSLLF